MYKDGKRWVIAGIAVVSFMGSSWMVTATAHADTSDTTAVTSAAAQSSVTSSNTATLTSPSAAEVTSSAAAQSATTSAASSAATTTSGATKNSAATSSAAVAAATSQTVASTAVVSSASSPVAASNATSQTVDAATSPVSSATSQITTTSAATSTALPNSVSGVTPISAAVTSVAPQTVAITPAAMVAPVTTVVSTVVADVKVLDTSKGYDGNANTPFYYEVQLNNGLVPPKNWYLGSAANVFLVLASSADLDLSGITSQNIGTYPIALSAQGIANLQAANPTVTIDASQIQSGTLTIAQGLVSTGAVWLTQASKYYDNNPATDPTAIDINLPGYLVADPSWVPVSGVANSYQIPVSSGDITWTGQEAAGTYTVNLTAQGLAKLQAANPNYVITAATVTGTTYQILTNNRVGVMTTVVGRGAKIPTTFTVTTSTTFVVPSDWISSYSNTGQDSVVYSIPASYLDTSAVNTAIVGSYPVSLSSATIAQLQALNSTAELLPSQVASGLVTVRANTPSVTLIPANFYVVWDDPKVTSSKPTIIANGSTTTLRLAAFGYVGSTATNLSEYIILPAGFEVASSASSSTVASDPTQVIAAAFQATGIQLTGLQVTQVASYNGRQSFQVTIANVSGSNDQPVELPIIATNPDHLTSGYLGTNAATPDDSVMYLTDDPTLTQNAYSINGYGAYLSVPSVAAFYGIQDAYALNSSYSAFVYPYQLVNAQVVDTYKLAGPGGLSLGANLTTQGISGSTYDPLSFLPATISANGHLYVLDQSSIVSPQTYPTINGILASTTTVSAGVTYTALYQQLTDPSMASGQIVVGTIYKNYDGSTSVGATTITVTVPSGFAVPTSWGNPLAGTSNQYAVPVSSGDFDLSGITSATPGTYPVTLSVTGQQAFAAANPLFLLGPANFIAGTLVIVPEITLSGIDPTGAAISNGIWADPQNNDAYSLNGTGASTLSIPSFPGYTYTLTDGTTTWYSNPTGTQLAVPTGTLTTKQNVNYTVTYTPTAQTLPVYYVDEDGNTIHSAGSVSGVTNGTYDATADQLTLPGYTFDKVSTGTLTGTFTVDGSGNVTTPAITLVYSTNYTVTPVDPNGTPIPGTTPVDGTGQPGDPVNTSTVPPIPGYTLTTTPTVPGTPGTVTAVYTPTAQTLPVYYVDENGNTIHPAGSVSGVTNGTYDATADQLTLPGYTFDKVSTGTLTGTFTVNGSGDVTTPAITLVYSTNYTVTPVDPNGTPIPGTTPVDGTGQPGDPVNTSTVPPIPGYTLTTTPTVPGTPGTVTAVYTPTAQTLPVYYVDENGNTIHSAGSVSGVTNGTYDATADQLTLPGYTFDKVSTGTLTGTFTVNGSGNVTTPAITLVYSTNYTVTPVDPNGTPIPGTTPVDGTGQPGDPVNTSTVPPIPGYTLTTTPTVPGTPGTVTAVYTPTAQTLPVYYVDENGNTIHSAGSVSGVTNGTYDATADQLTLPGYTFDKVSTGTLTGTFTVNGSGDVTTPAITLVYSTNYTVTPVDPNGTPIPGTTPVDGTGQPGDPVNTSTVPPIPGYTLTTTPTVPGTPGTVTAVYTPNSQQIVVHYVDENGTTIHPDGLVTGVTNGAYDATAQEITIGGYTFDKVSTGTLIGTFTVDSQGQLTTPAITLVYDLIPVVGPSTPSPKPTNPSPGNGQTPTPSPAKPGGPSSHQTTQPKAPQPITAGKPKTAGVVSAPTVSSKSQGPSIIADQPAGTTKSGQLPQTNERSGSLLALLGWVLSFSLGIGWFGLRSRNRRRHDQ